MAVFKGKGARMHQLSEIQEQKIGDTIRAYIATIPVNTLKDIVKLAEFLPKLSEDQSIATDELPKVMQPTVDRLKKYLQYLFESDPEDNKHLKLFAKTIICERIDALHVINEDSEFDAYLRMQKNLGTANPGNRYPPVLQILFDFHLLEPEKTNFSTLIFDFCPPKEYKTHSCFDLEEATAALRNQFVIQALKKGYDLYSYIERISLYIEITRFAEEIVTDEKLGQLFNWGLWSYTDFTGEADYKNFYDSKEQLTHPIVYEMLEKNVSGIKELLLYLQSNSSTSRIIAKKLLRMLVHPLVGPLMLAEKITINNIIGSNFDRSIKLFCAFFNFSIIDGWCENETIEIAEILSNESVQPLVESGHINSARVHTWGKVKTSEIIEYARKPNVQELIDKKLLAFSNMDSLESIQDRVSKLSEFKEEIEKLIEEKIIINDEVDKLINLSRARIGTYIGLMNKHAEYFKSGVVAFRYMECELLEPEKYYNVFFADLEITTEPVRAFLAKTNSQYLLQEVQTASDRRQFLDALWFSHIRELLITKAISNRNVIDDFFSSSENKKKYMPFLFDINLKKRYYYGSCGLLSSIMSDPDTFSLFQFDYLSSEEIIEFQWRPQLVAYYAKFKLLKKLHNELPEVPQRSINSLFSRDISQRVAKELNAALSELNRLKPKYNFEHYDEPGHPPEKATGRTIDRVFNKVLEILEKETKTIKDAKLREFCENAFQQLNEFTKISQLKNYYDIGKWHLEQSDDAKAYENFICVVESDPNYGDAMFQAGSIAFTKHNYSDASYLLTNSLNNIPRSEENNTIRGQLQTLLDVVKRCLEGKDTLEEHGKKYVSEPTTKSEPTPHVAKSLSM